MIPAERSRSSEKAMDSIELSIADKLVLRAEGKLGIVVAAVTVVAVAGIWMFTSTSPPPVVTTISGTK